MPKAKVANPLYTGPNYNDPTLGVAAQNIAAMILGGESPNDAAERESTAALRGEQERKTRLEGDILSPRAFALNNPTTFSNRVQDDLAGQSPNAAADTRTIYDLIIGGGTSDAVGAGNARRMNMGDAAMNRNGTDIAGALGLPPGEISTRQAALKGDDLFSVSDEGLLQKKSGLLTETPGSRAAIAKKRSDASGSGGPITPVTLRDPKNPNETIVVDGRSGRLIGAGPKLSQVGSADQKLRQKKPQAKLRTDSMIANIDELDTAIADLAKDSGLSHITGPVAGRTYNLTAAATRTQGKLDSIKSKIFVSALQAMREASKTGGAVGNVSDREGDKLERTLAALDQAIGTSDFKIELEKAQKQLRLSRQLIQTAYDEEYGGLEDGVAPGAPPAAGGPVIGTIDGNHRFKGGNPADPNNWEPVQ